MSGYILCGFQLGGGLLDLNFFRRGGHPKFGLWIETSADPWHLNNERSLISRNVCGREFHISAAVEWKNLTPYVLFEFIKRVEEKIYKLRGLSLINSIKQEHGCKILFIR